MSLCVLYEDNFEKKIVKNTEMLRTQKSILVVVTVADIFCNVFLAHIPFSENRPYSQRTGLWSHVDSDWPINFSNFGVDHDRTSPSLQNSFQKSRNRALECWLTGGPAVWGVKVLGLELPFSAIYTKMQKNLLFGKEKSSSFLSLSI